MEFLVSVVAAQFKDALLMTEQDELPFEENYFQLGLNSLRVIDIKTGLEELLGREVDAALLFSQPTVRQLLDHLAGAVLADFFPGVPAAEPVGAQAEATAENAMVEDLFKRIYDY